MGNLGQREKYGIGLVIVLIIAFVIYFAGIRSLQNQKVDLENQRTDLQNQINTLQALKDNNDATQSNIKAIEAAIEDLETTFIPVINTEVIEKYVIDSFADKNCHFLNTISSETIVPETIILPDGSVSADNLQIVRVTVQFATGDGFNVSQYNMTPNYREEREQAALLRELLYDVEGAPVNPEDENDLLYDESLPLIDYNNFIEGVKVLEKAGATGDAPSPCIKLNSVMMESEGGYMLVTAEIDFYSANLTNRISKPNFDAPYITWEGDVSKIGTDGEMGRRLLWIESASDWNNTIMVDEDVKDMDRPFAAYWSNALFDKAVREKGGLATVLVGPQEEDETQIEGGEAAGDNGEEVTVEP